MKLGSPDLALATSLTACMLSPARQNAGYVAAKTNASGLVIDHHETQIVPGNNVFPEAFPIRS
jgi:hypothetical protein